MKLPNGDRADLGDKLETYSLNPAHREGRHKARVFASALGITLDEAGVLRDAILRAATESADAEARGDSGFGRVFVLRFPLETVTGKAEVLTAWIIRRDEDFPRDDLLYPVTPMNPEIKMLDLVAPTEDLLAQHFLTDAPLTLRRGQIGTVVMIYDDESAFEVEFADAQGRAFALLPIAAEKLMLLHDAPVASAA